MLAVSACCCLALTLRLENSTSNAFALTLKSPFPVIVKGGLEGMLTSRVVADRQVPI